MTNPKAQSFYLPQLDGLRFIAYALVFVSHYRWAPDALAQLPVVGRAMIVLHRHGGIGVDLFLTLSAYLITTLLLIEREAAGRISLKAFYIRRTLRIWPLYYFALMVFYLVVPLLQGDFNGVAHQAGLSAHGPSFMFFVGNIFLPLADVVPPLYTGHLWTVSLEEQFYLVWPLSFVALSKYGKATIGFLVAAIIASIGARAIVVLLGLDGVAWTSFFTRLDPFALGALLAIYRHRRTGAPKWSNLKFIAGIVMICLAYVPANLSAQTWAVTWQYLVIALGFTLILDASICLDHRSLIGRLLRSRVFVRLGKLSYGMYVYHMGIIALAGGMGVSTSLELNKPVGWFLVGTLAFGLTVFAAHVSYEVLEKPFLRLKRRFTVVASRPD